MPRLPRPGLGQRWQRRAVAVASAVLLSACGSEGGDAGVTEGDGTVDFPVSWTYAGMEWSIVDAETETDESDNTSVAMNMRITNQLPGDVGGFDHGEATQPTQSFLDVSMIDGDDVTVARGDSFEVPDGISEGETVKGTWTFPVKEEPDLADLTLIMQHEDRTPAIVPLAGKTFDLPEPVPAEIEADDVVATAVSCGAHWGVAEFSEFEAEVGWIDHLGVRALSEHRLLAISTKFLWPDDNALGRLGCGFGYTMGEGHFYLEVDGDERHPARGWPAADYSANDSGTETLIFEVPRDAEDVVLVIDGAEDDGETPETFRFPITYDALPACCEE